MRKILVYLSPEKQPSLFDIIVGYDSGADIVIPYANVGAEDVEDIVHGCLFTRAPDDLRNTAIFIGGLDVKRAEDIMEMAREVAGALPKMFSVSIALDPNGALTTSSACVLKILGKMKGVGGLKATVLAGTGPVGQRTATLLAKEGCDVTITSRKIQKASEVCDGVSRDYKLRVKPFEVNDDKSLKEAISGSRIVVAAGSEGVRVLPEKAWLGSGIGIMADLNAVPPYGIEGLEPHDDYKDIGGVIGVGAIATGNLKMKIHRNMIKRLFEEKDVVFDLEKVYELGKSLR